MVNSGLQGVVAATTQLSHVDGERGELVIAGFQVDQLAEFATFEETTWLLWHGDLPSIAELDTFCEALAAARGIPDATIAVLRACAHRQVDAMDALRMAAGTLSLVSADASEIVARVPTIVASY
jgi:citrate synthase